MVDDSTRWMVVQVLETKGQACATFMKFKSKAENFTSEHINFLRSDQGGEFLAEAFKYVCVEASIKR